MSWTTCQEKKITIEIAYCTDGKLAVCIYALMSYKILLIACISALLDELIIS